MINILILPWYFYFQKSFGIILIIVGFVALVTPIMPGSWLLPIGITMIIGKEKTFALSKKILGIKWHDKLQIERILHLIIKKDTSKKHQLATDEKISDRNNIL